MQLEAVTVLPTNSQIVFAGSGSSNGVPDPGNPQRSIGALRSTDGGVSWCRIGPTCITGACPGNNATSDLAVPSISVDSTGRVWAATSKGLWWSSNAADPTKCTGTCDCSAITWNLATLPAKKADNVTPDTVFHVFLSPSNSQVLYAAVTQSDTSPSHNGWWKSTNYNGSWTQVLALTNGDYVGRAAIQNEPTAPDIIWSIVGGPSFCGGNGLNRLYRTMDSGSTWTLLTTNVDCNFFRSVAVDSGNASYVALGREGLFRSTNGTALPPTSITFSEIGQGLIHADHNALRFQSTGVLFDGNDGGIWEITNFTTTPTFNNLNTNLANAEFYHGTTDTLNYGVSFGGTQDNSTLRGGSPPLWDLVLRNASGDASGTLFIDPTNSNAAYYTTFQQSYVVRTLDGYGPNTFNLLTNGFPAGGLSENSLTMDPSSNGGNTTLAVSTAPPSPVKVYRTTTANAAASWQSITGDTGLPGAVLPAYVRTMSIAPLSSSQTAPSNRVFAGLDGQGLWCTNNANDATPRWRGGLGNAGGQLPNRSPKSIGIGSSCASTLQPCTSSCPCTLYVSMSGFDENTNVPSHVFRTASYTGQDCNLLSWTNVSGVKENCSGLICPTTGRSCVNGTCPYYAPNVPANEALVDPANPNVLYLGTDMGVFQGCLGCRSSDGTTCNPSGSSFICTASGTVWVWDKLTNGFPQAVQVMDLSIHQDSRVLRAWTYGRSVWEAQLPGVPNRDQKVNTTTPVTGAVGVRIGSTKVGDFYSASWADDRAGANNFHLYSRAYNYDANGNPTPLSVTDVRVDDTSAHVVSAPALAAHPTQTSAPCCARSAWHDDRLALGVNQHIYNQYACSSGFKLFGADLRVDQHATNINATNAAITNQQDNAGQALDYMVAWQADHAVGSTLHDVYARFFGVLGTPKWNQFQVNTSIANVDAINPAVASDASLNVFIAWEEFTTSNLDGSIWISKYNADGTTLLAGPVRGNTNCLSGTGCNGTAATERHTPSLAVDSAGSVIVAWWERRSDGTQLETIVRRRLTNNLAALDASQVLVPNPPAAPYGVQRVGYPWVATDSLNNIAISWVGYINDPAVNFPNGFAKSLNSSGAVLKSDFRLDLAGRAAGAPPRVARSSQSGKFAYAWRDIRSSRWEVYTRVVKSLP